MSYVLRWKNSEPPLYYLIDPGNPDHLCGCEDIHEATKFLRKEDAEALPLDLPLSDGRGLWDLYEFIELTNC